VNESSTDDADSRDLVFMCADTGAVVAVTYTAAERPALTRAVMFLASGATAWIDGAGTGGTRATFAVRDHGSAGQFDLRLSALARLVAGAGQLVSGKTATGPGVPASLELTFEPASQRLPLGPEPAPPGQVTLVRGSGSLAIGSVIHRVTGSAWSAAGPGAGPGGQADCRALAVFQDGSALFTATGAGPAGPAGPVAALVHNTRIRAAAVRDFTVRDTGHGRPGQRVSWAGEGRSRGGADGTIRDPGQQLVVTRPDPTGPGWLSWSCAPFVFVRSGVTGLGLVERRTRLATPVTEAEPAGELPDPY
jgi:hypothetical protein